MGKVFLQYDAPMSSSDFNPFKVFVTTLADLSLVSAHLQDGLLSVSSLDYDQGQKRFMGLVNRFCWMRPNETAHDPDTHYRVHTGFCFQNVEGVFSKGFDQGSPQRIFSILTLSFDEASRNLTILCSDDCQIRLKLSELYGQVADLDEPWPTFSKPLHPEFDGSGKWPKTNLL